MSPLESEPFILQSYHNVEGELSIVGEDNITSQARRTCHLGVLRTRRAECYQQPNTPNMEPQATSPSPASGPAGHPFQSNGNSRPRRVAATTLLGDIQCDLKGGTGSGCTSRSGKSSLKFDHILSGLQGGLQKSGEMDAELHHLSGPMNDIHYTLGGSLPSNLPRYPSALPPIRPPPQNLDSPGRAQQPLPAASLSSLLSLIS